MRMRLEAHFLPLLAQLSVAHLALAQGAASTYKGWLADNAVPASGTDDLTFTMFDAIRDGYFLGQERPCETGQDQQSQKKRTRDGNEGFHLMHLEAT